MTVLQNPCDLYSLSVVCDGIRGSPLIRIPKAPLEVVYEGTSFLLVSADLKLFKELKLSKCEWRKNGKIFKFTKCLKCNQICGKLASCPQSSVFCENCIKKF